MRKALTLALAMCLVAALTGIAVAGKKRKPKPYRSEDVEISVGHTAFVDPDLILNVTAQEFIRTCGTPSSNGFDAYVFEVPAPYRKIETVAITAHGEGGSPYAPDPDIYLFTESCELTDYYLDVGPSEFGVMSKGTAFILISNGSIAGGPMSAWFELQY